MYCYIGQCASSGEDPFCLQLFALETNSWLCLGVAVFQPEESYDEYVNHVWCARMNAMNAMNAMTKKGTAFVMEPDLQWSPDLFLCPSCSRCSEVFWADDGVRLRRALNGLLERAYAKRQACLYQTQPGLAHRSQRTPIILRNMMDMMDMQSDLCFCMFQDVPRCSKMFQDVPSHSRLSWKKMSWCQVGGLQPKEDQEPESHVLEASWSIIAETKWNVLVLREFDCCSLTHRYAQYLTEAGRWMYHNVPLASSWHFGLADLSCLALVVLVRSWYQKSLVDISLVLVVTASNCLERSHVARQVCIRLHSYDRWVDRCSQMFWTFFLVCFIFTSSLLC